MLRPGPNASIGAESLGRRRVPTASLDSAEECECVAAGAFGQGSVDEVSPSSSVRPGFAPNRLLQIVRVWTTIAARRVMASGITIRTP